MKFPLGAMSVGDVLDRGLKVLFARLPVFYAINLIVLAPITVVQILLPILVQDGQDIRSPEAAVGLLVGALVVLVLAVVLSPLGTAAILHVVMQEFVGQRATLGQAFRFAFSRLGTLIVASLLVGLIVGVGFLLCIAPGVYFFVSYLFVGQVVVLERMAAGDSLTRSKELIDGFRGRVFGVLLLIGFVTAVVSGVMGAALEKFLPQAVAVPTDTGLVLQVNPVNVVIATVVQQLVSILFTTYGAVCTTLLYLDLRIRKEGFDLELAARQTADPDAPPADDGDRP